MIKMTWQEQDRTHANVYESAVNLRIREENNVGDLITTFLSVQLSFLWLAPARTLITFSINKCTVVVKTIRDFQARKRFLVNFL